MIKNKESKKIMSETEFAHVVAKMTGRTVVDSKEVVKDFLNAFKYVCAEEQPIRFIGAFQTKFTYVPEKTIHVFLNDTDVVVPEHMRLTIKPSKMLYKEPVQKVETDANDVDQFI